MSAARADAGELAYLYFRLPVEHIAYVVAVVEAYEGVAMVTSPTPDRGEIAWEVPRSQLAEARRLAADLAREVLLIEIPRPADWA